MKIYGTGTGMIWPAKVASIYKSHSDDKRHRTTHHRAEEIKELLRRAKTTATKNSEGEKDMRQLVLPLDDETIQEEGLFEIYQYHPSKSGYSSTRTYARHVKFVRAPSMAIAEDYAADLYPEFWKNSIAIRDASLVTVYAKMDELEKQLEACIEVLN